jgi:hypothetical protein
MRILAELDAEILESERDDPHGRGRSSPGYPAPHLR